MNTDELDQRPPSGTSRTITVSGTGTAAVAPDVADVRLGIAATAATVAEVRASTAAAMTAILEAVRGCGVANQDIHTSLLSVSPTYDYSSGETPPRLTGYAMSNVATVRVRDLDRVADVVDRSLDAGATSLDGLTFRREDTSDAERAARQAAVRAARRAADAIASEAGLEIVALQRLTEAAPDGGGPRPFEGAKLMVRDAATPIEPGSEEVSVTVVATYQVR